MFRVENIQRLFPHTTLLYNRDGECLLRGTDCVFICKSQYLSNIASVITATMCNVLPLLQPGTAAAQRDTGSVSQRSLTAHTTDTAGPQLAADIVGLKMQETANTKMKKHIPLSSVGKKQLICKLQMTCLLRLSVSVVSNHSQPYMCRLFFSDTHWQGYCHGAR